MMKRIILSLGLLALIKSFCQHPIAHYALDRNGDFPNPTAGEFEVKNSVNFESINIYTISGELLEANVETLSLINYPNGVYLVELVSDGVSVMKRVIKE